MTRLYALAVAFGLAAAAAGFATQAAAQSAADRAACEGDAKKLCPGVIPIGGKMLDCLAKHKAELSDACKKVVTAQGR